MSEWIVTGTPRGGRVALVIEAPCFGETFVWGYRAFAAMFGRRTAHHWQLGDVDLRTCTARWIDEHGEPASDKALDGASLLCSSGVQIPLARTARLLGLESPEAFVAESEQSKRAGKDRAAGDTSQPAKRVAAAAVAFDTGADWVDQNSSPLGKRKHLRLCREGAFTTARKQGKQWLVRRAEIDALIQNGSKSKSAKITDASDIDRELVALGMGEP